MAKVQVRIKIDTIFNTTCTGTNAEEVCDYIMNHDLMAEDILNKCYDNMEIESAEYDIIKDEGEDISNTEARENAGDDGE